MIRYPTVRASVHFLTPSQKVLVSLLSFLMIVFFVVKKKLLFKIIDEIEHLFISYCAFRNFYLVHVI